MHYGEEGLPLLSCFLRFNVFPCEAQLQSCLSGLVEALLAPPTEAKNKTTAQRICKTLHNVQYLGYALVGSAIPKSPLSIDQVCMRVQYMYVYLIIQHSHLCIYMYAFHRQRILV